MLHLYSVPYLDTLHAFSSRHIVDLARCTHKS